jgi:hypothetical protein
MAPIFRGHFFCADDMSGRLPCAPFFAVQFSFEKMVEIFLRRLFFSAPGVRQYG